MNAPTFDGLFGEKVVFHDFDSLGRWRWKTLCQILDDESAGEFGELVLECRRLMTQSTADIDHHYSGRILARSLAQSLQNGIEVGPFFVARVEI